MPIVQGILLRNSEEYLKNMLRQKDWPFLGLFGDAFNDDMKRCVADRIKANNTIHALLNNLEKYPAVFTIYICYHLSQTFGQTDAFQVWPDLKRILGRADAITQQEREALWNRFRLACKSLGAEVSNGEPGAHYLVNEFLQQTGLSATHATDFARRAFQFANKHGLPDDDDPQGIILWQQNLEKTLNPPFSQVARRAICGDTKGFYTQMLLSIIRENGQVENVESTIIQALLTAYKEYQEAQPGGLNNLGNVRSAFPEIQFRNASLGIVLPGGHDGEWIVTVDTHTHRYAATGCEQFIVIDQLLPKSVTVGINGEVQEFNLWADDRNNQILLFSSETGLLKARGALGQTITVPPGSYRLLSRFDPNLEGVESECVSENPKLVLSSISLFPSNLLQIHVGPATLTLKATDEVSIGWLGNDNIVSREGVPVYFGGDFKVQVEVPIDMRTSEFEIKISVGKGGNSTISRLDINDEGKAIVSVSAAAGQWQAGVWRVLVKVRRCGEARTLCRSAAYYWNGLEEFRGGIHFSCVTNPTNLFVEGCENIVVSNTGISCANVAHRLMRLVFKLKKEREIGLTWSVPGLFVDLIEYPVTGQMIKKQFEIGKKLIVSSTSSQHIVVSADRLADIKIGTFVRRVNFPLRASITLPLGTLVDYMNAGNSRLIYAPVDGSPEIEIAKIERPQQIISFNANVNRIKFISASLFSAVQLRCLNILTGKEKIFIADCETEVNQNDANLSCKYIITNENNYEYTLTIGLNELNCGAWIFWPEVLSCGNWCFLTSESGDYFVGGALLASDGNTMPIENFRNVIRDSARFDLFSRFDEAIRYCYARSVWTGISWLETGWKLLLEKCSVQEENLVKFLNVVVAPWPDSTSPGWLPHLTVASQLPVIFALDAPKYMSIEAGKSLLLRSILAIYKLDVGGLHNNVGQVLHPSCMAGFNNFAAIVRGEDPSGFDPTRFMDGMRQLDERENQYLMADENYVPSDGQLTGPIHYRYAKHQLSKRFNRLQEDNIVSRGQAINMARRSQQLFSALLFANANLRPVLNPYVQVELNEDTELVSSFEHFISTFAWYARRSPKELECFLQQVTPENVDRASPLSFLLYVGEDLLSFYLLLWEVVQKSVKRNSHLSKGDLRCQKLIL